MDKDKKKTELAKDDRFSHILENPVYRRVPKKKKKVDIDNRFTSISDQPIFQSIRGEGIAADEESSSDSESSCDEELEQNVIQEWGEMDRDAPRTEEATRRLALCNMDWDRLSAEDLMILFHSFLPVGGVLQAVTIYPSEFGKERLAEEDLHGPKELVDNTVSENESEEEKEGDDDEGEGSGYNMEKLRTYQLKRLKYYYAVLEFDSKETADKVYTECDGMEYESSATRLDLRFVPEDMTFDDEPKEKCDSVPDGQKYRPRFFVTTALQQAKVDLTWDETDPKRMELIGKIYDPKEKIEDEDIKAYLASSSSESDEEIEGDETHEGDDKKKDTVGKYKALLQSIEDTEKKKKNKDVEMEITWGVGLKQKSEQLVKKRLEEEKAAKMTPWEKMLAKRREKRQTRKTDGKKAAQGENDESSNSEVSNDSDSEEMVNSNNDEPFSDDDVDVDMSDPFFKQEFSTNEIFKHSKKIKQKKEEKLGNKKSKESSKRSKEEDKKQAELELLLMDEEQDNKRHFSLKKIMDAESESTSKKKKKKRLHQNAEDDFQVDLQDDRFSAVYTSHKYNVDPSNPSYRKTKGMEAIIMEKQKRRYPQVEENVLKDDTFLDVASSSKELTGTKESIDQTNEFFPAAKRSKSELSYLVKSIKGKTQNLMSKKQSSSSNSGNTSMKK